MSNEYQPGDLVEATLGDTIIRGHITGCSGDYVGNSRRTVGALLDDNFTITVIEKAKPKVELPTEPGVYISWVNSPSPTVAHKLRDGRWVDADDAYYKSETEVAELMPLTRLEPVAVTAKAVLDEVGKFAWADGFTAQIEATAKKFGVTS